MNSVLIVDDDDAFRNTIGRDLEEQGFAVALAATVEEALPILERRAIDVLLTDLRMPGADGIDLLERLRATSSRTRAILMSGFASARDYQRAIECGAVRVLCKPFTSSELLQAIRQAVDCETGFRGSIHGLSLVDLLQMFHYARRSLAIVVDGIASGHVFLEEGRIIHAHYRELSGEPALRAILAMPAGSLRTMVLPEGTPHSITSDFAALLLDCLRTLDETQVMAEGSLDAFDEPPTAPITVAGLPAAPALAPPFAAPPHRPRSHIFFERLRRLDGYTASCLVDAESGVVLGADAQTDIQDTGFDLHVAAAGYAELYRTQRATIASLQLDDRLEDVLITLPLQYHVIHALAAQPQLFLYVVIDRGAGNLGLARFALAAAEAALDA